MVSANGFFGQWPETSWDPQLLRLFLLWVLFRLFQGFGQGWLRPGQIESQLDFQVHIMASNQHNKWIYGLNMDCSKLYEFRI
jgi:hypothetical protein